MSENTDAITKEIQGILEKDKAEAEQKKMLWSRIEMVESLFKMRTLTAEVGRMTAEMERLKEKFPIEILEGMLKDAEGKLAGDKKEQPIAPPPSPIKPVEPPKAEIIEDTKLPEGVYC
jgi:hypothetical protein